MALLAKMQLAIKLELEGMLLPAISTIPRGVLAKSPHVLKSTVNASNPAFYARAFASVTIAKTTRIRLRERLFLKVSPKLSIKLNSQGRWHYQLEVLLSPRSSLRSTLTRRVLRKEEAEVTVDLEPTLMIIRLVWHFSNSKCLEIKSQP